MVSGLARNDVSNVASRSNVSFYDCRSDDLLATVQQDSDGDGLPDIDDRSPGINDQTSSIASFNDSVDELSDSLDDLVEGLCG